MSTTETKPKPGSKRLTREEYQKRVKEYTYLHVNPGPPKRDKKRPVTLKYAEWMIRWRYREAKFLFGWTSQEHEDMKDLIVTVFHDLKLYGDDDTVEGHEWYEVIRRNMHSHGGTKSIETQKAGLPVRRSKNADRNRPGKGAAAKSAAKPAAAAPAEDKRGSEPISAKDSQPAAKSAPTAPTSSRTSRSARKATSEQKDFFDKL